MALTGPAARRRGGRAIGICCGLALALAAGCRADGKAAATPAPGLEVELSGCSALAPGPRCVPPLQPEPIRIVARAPPGARISVSDDGGGAVPFQTTAVEGAVRLALTIPAAARALVVVAAGATERRAATVAIERPPRDPRIDRAMALRLKGESEAARTILRQALPTLHGALKTEARSRLARTEMSLNNLPEALKLLGEAAEEHRAAGRLTAAADDATITAFIHIDRTANYREARAALDRAAGWAGGYPDGRVRIAYYRSHLASRTGDVRGALAEAERAVEESARAGSTALGGLIPQRAAVVLQQLGRWEDARKHRAAARAMANDPTSPCALADALAAEAWVLLLAREAGVAPGAGDDPTPLLRQAEAELDRRCPQPHKRADVKVNLALAAVHDGRLGEAEQALEEARALAPDPAPLLTFWSLEVAARVARARHRPRVALEAYDRMERLADAAAVDDARWRARLGRARALVALGRRDQAAADYGRAEAVLDGEAMSVPLTDGLEGFLAERETASGEHVALLVDLKRSGEALEVARRARARFFTAVARRDEMTRLDGEARDRWETAVAGYKQERAALEKEAARDWTLSRQALDEVKLGRRRRFERLQGLLDQALAVLPPRARALPGPAPGEGILAYFQDGAGGWLGFWASGDEVVGRRLGAVDASRATADDLAQALLLPFRRELLAARAVRILPAGSLRAVDFHALPFEGAPLVVHAPVVYGLDVARGGIPAASSSPASALVVANPRGHLPGARDEGRLARDQLTARGSAATLIEGQAATRARVLAALPGIELFHYAGHGVFGGEDLEDGRKGDGWSSVLLLSGRDTLGVGDVLTLRAPPRHVLLSACEAARQKVSLAAEGISLAHAFVLAGSEVVVAATRPVPDEVSLALMRTFYAALRLSPPAEALRQAQRALNATAGTKDWPSFRVFSR